jgi:hypothetical protein
MESLFIAVMEETNEKRRQENEKQRKEDENLQNKQKSSSTLGKRPRATTTGNLCRGSHVTQEDEEGKGDKREEQSENQKSQ